MKLLVIVDVQFEFSNHFSKEYLEQLKSFMLRNKHRYDQVIAIYSESSAEQEEGKKIPAFINNFADTTIEKWFYIIDDDFLTMDDVNFSKNKDGILEDKHGNVILTRTNTEEPEDFLLPHALIKMARGLGETGTVDLVGGAKDCCLEEVRVLFDYFKAKTNVIEELTYDLQWTFDDFTDKQRRFKDYEWVEVSEEKHNSM